MQEMYLHVLLSASMSPTNCEAFNMCSAQRGSINAFVPYLNVSCVLPPANCTFASSVNTQQLLALKQAGQVASLSGLDNVCAVFMA